MTCKLPDIDIDVIDRKEILKLIPHVKASRLQNDTLVEHGPGIHVQRISANHEINLSNIPYEEAEERCYWKLDILNNPTPYENIKHKAEIRNILETFDCWELFEYKEIVEQLFHIRNHADFVVELKPKSIDDLAFILALIRPWGQKLLSMNLSQEEFNKEIWNPKEGIVGFKKSHAFAYAAAIIVQVGSLK